MLCEIQPWWVVFALLVFNILQPFFVHGDPQVPCFFIFGDSLVDSGNNNNLSTLAKSNYPPYGIDYPEGPTGRFTNGRTTVDFLAEMLGFDHHIPSYVSSKDSNNDTYILQGVNYASGSGGIRDETGSHLGTCIGLQEQIRNHRNIFCRIMNNVFKNKEKAQQHLNKCLYYVGIGNNDYINNFFEPEKYPNSKRYTIDQFTDSLIQLYASHMRSLYQYYGARKFILVGTGQIGCTPRAIATKSNHGPTGCIDEMNKASEGFNKKLLSLVDRLNGEYKNAKFIYINMYETGLDDPSSLGYKVFGSGCCTVREDGQCGANQSPCQNRREFVFWDSFHPTESVNEMNARRMLKSFNPNDSHLFDISHLVDQKSDRPPITRYYVRRKRRAGRNSPSQ